MTLYPAYEKSMHTCIRVNPKEQTVNIGKNTIDLTQQECLLLLTLAKKPCSTISREELLYIAWDCSYPIKTRTVDMHIARLRKKIGRKLIKTERGKGYSLQAIKLN